MSGTLFEKIDRGLALALRAYEMRGSRGHTVDGLSVTLRFRNDLQAIEALGFQTRHVMGDEALGIVLFKDVAALSQHPDVVAIAAGQAPQLDLDRAVHEIRVRASTPQSVGGTNADGLWHYPITTNDDGPHLTFVADATGRDVLVAIIDSGIDYTHPMFMRQLTPERRTRILRIWDQGLPPTSLDDCPPAAFTASGERYGVEYLDDDPHRSRDINRALASGTPLPHRDCAGHGTHIAGIAAGGVLYPRPQGDATRVGVAPEASILVVKFIDVPEDIFPLLASGQRASQPVGHLNRFKDAVLYCLKTAEQLRKPVVINVSFSNYANPGDALDEEAVWIDKLLGPTPQAGVPNFPRSAVLVKSAGNSGRRGRSARIVVPRNGEIIVPFQLRDTREPGTNNTWLRCVREPYRPAIAVNFWYRRQTPFTSVQFAMRLPGEPHFGDGVGVGGQLTRGFVVRAGAPPRLVFVPPADNVHTVFLEHLGNGAVTHPDGTSIRRHNVVFGVAPKFSAGTVTYYPGIYEIRIQAPARTEIFAICQVAGWSGDEAVGFDASEHMQNGDPLHANIDLGSPYPRYSAPDTLGAYAITVAAYNDHNGHLMSSASRGPLRDFSDPGTLPRPPLVADKPDVAAPGVEIDSALAADAYHGVVSPGLQLGWHAGVRFQSLTGSSFAAPMVAGVIALLLDKRPDLDTEQVRQLLTTTGRAPVEPATQPDAREGYGIGGLVDALRAHNPP
jgi:subtilisin family serine protease